MKKTQAKQKTKHEEIIEIILKDSKSVMKKEDVIDRLEYLLFMLTNKQKQCLLDKLQRCTYYIDLLSRGMHVARVKSILKRKHEIHRQNIHSVCKPCDNYMRYKT